ncbi:glutamate--tRNA ligase [Candidatus Saccharibacteria bacterium]|nr:MAG: glutamate--tRNA ligase [Candidatus Saccharibacteria bacterium]
MKPVRTRFAPSPTGFLHVGNVRAALFPWLVAKQAGGTFVLRVEDTDQAREVEGAVEYMRETLQWLGMDWDEGPDMPGDFGPYVQSERKATYLEWAQRMVDEGTAYADTRTPEELNALREDAKAKKKPFLARDYRPENPVKWGPGMPLRFKSTPKAYDWHDLIMGELHAGDEAVDDFIIIKSDGLPTYNFAHIIDDNAMQITHVIRGLEYISSMPKYLNLYEALGFEKPQFAHAPHIMAPDGKKKLSKRDGAKSILQYRDEGFLPEAMLNFLASLGWNDGTEQEIFTREELIAKFSLERVQRSGAIFDERRLLWMNGSWIRALDTGTIYTQCQDFWPESAKTYPEEYKRQVLALVQERLKYFAELPELTNFFFEDLPVNMELIDGNKQLKKFTHEELKTLLETSKQELGTSDWSTEDLSEKLNGLLETTGQKPGVLFSLIRIASTQAPSSPSLAETLAVLGREVSLRRIATALASL